MQFRERNNFRIRQGVVTLKGTMKLFGMLLLQRQEEELVLQRVEE
jgi:hypothetical protein